MFCERRGHKSDFITADKKSGLKFGRVVMANPANREDIIFPSLKFIAEVTAQDIETVQENFLKWGRPGYLSDTGIRKGQANRVIVY